MIMGYLITIIGVILILLIGILRITFDYRSMASNTEFINEFRTGFNDMAISFNANSGFDFARKVDEDLYVWLTLNVSKAQRILGHVGIMDTFVAPLGRFTARNYHILLNTLPKFRDNTIHDSEIGFADDCMLRYLGEVDELKSKFKRELKNPFIWFNKGIKEILSIPILLLSWFDILSFGAVDKARSGVFYNLFSGFVSLIMLVSALVTIIIGRDEVCNFIRSLFN